MNKDGDGIVGAGNWNSKSRDNAQALTNDTTFQFIVTLVIVKYIHGEKLWTLRPRNSSGFAYYNKKTN